MAFQKSFASSSSFSPTSLSSSNPISGIPSFTDFHKLLAMGGLGGAIAACAVIFSVLAVVFVFLRMVVRFHLKTLGLDDYSMVMATLLFVVDNALAIVASLYGIGVQGFKVDLTRPLFGSQWVVIWGFVYAITTIPVKVSVCLSILRVKKGPLMRYTACFLVGLTILAALVQIALMASACIPFSYLWDQATQQGSCPNIGTAIISIYLFSAVCAFVDWVVTLLVGFAIWKTDMPWTRKLLSLSVVSFGIFASIATAVRIFFIRSYAGLGYDSPDFYYSLGGITLSSQFETGLLILGSCAPMALRGIELVNWRFWNKVNGKWSLLKPKQETAIDDEESAKLLGNEVIITTGNTAGKKKNKPKSKTQRQKSKKRCSECGKRNCKDHRGIVDPETLDPATIDPNNVPEGYILVTETVEVTYESAEGYNVADSAIAPFADVPVSRPSSRANALSRAASSRGPVVSRPSSLLGPVVPRPTSLLVPPVSRASSSGGPHYRQQNLPAENIFALDTLTPEGRLASSGSASAAEGSTRVNSITSESGVVVRDFADI